MADTVLIPNEGKIYKAQVGVAKQAAENIRLALFINDVTPSATSVVADFTQMSNHGITHKELAGASWAEAVMDGDRAKCIFADQTFLATALNNGDNTPVFGLIAYSATTSKLLWIHKFENVKNIQYEDDSVVYSPEDSYEQAA